MPRQDNRITAQAAAKILGTTSENLRQLGKAGILSYTAVNTGKKVTFYYSEQEVRARKEASAEYLSIAKDTEDVLNEAKKAYAEAEKAWYAAADELRRAENLPRSFTHLHSLCDTLLKLSGNAAEMPWRERQIIYGLMEFKSLRGLASENGVSRERVRQIAAKAVRRLMAARNRLARNEKTEERNKELEAEVEALKNKLELVKREIKVLPDNEILVLSPAQMETRAVLLSDVAEVFAYPDRLHSRGIKQVYQLMYRTPEELRRMGITAWDYYRRANSLGLRFGMDITEYGIFPNETILKRRKSLRGVDELSEEEQRIRKLLMSSVEDFGLSVRCLHCMADNGVETLADLCSLKASEVRRWKSFGRKSMNELVVLLEKLHLCFGMDVVSFGVLPNQRIISDTEENSADRVKEYPF
jgi:hypothetical protein